MLNFFKVILGLSILAVFTGALFFYAESRAASTAGIAATVAVGVCGNNIVESGEACDGSALDGQTCQSRGFDGGTLFCDSGCDLDVSQCADLRPEEGSVVFSGTAYPLGVVKILKDGQIAATTAGDANGDFETTLSGLATGAYTFAVYAYDSNGKKSKAVTYYEEITTDAIKKISDIIVPPTLSASKKTAERGEQLVFSGQSAPNATVSIYLDSGAGIKTVRDKSASNGYYSYKLDTDSLEADNYSAVARVVLNEDLVSAESEKVFFEIKTGKNEGSAGAGDPLQASDAMPDFSRADFNDDSRVNLVDFSVYLHYFGKGTFPSAVDADRDGKIDLRDLSIMMYFWTG